MKNFISFYCEFEGKPQKENIILDDVDFDNLDSAFFAIHKYKNDGFADVKLSWRASDFVLDTRKIKLYVMAENGIPEIYEVSDNYLTELLEDIS